MTNTLLSIEDEYAFSFFFTILSHAQQRQVNYCHTFKNGCEQGCGPCISSITVPLGTILG